MIIVLILVVLFALDAWSYKWSDRRQMAKLSAQEMIYRDTAGDKKTKIAVLTLADGKTSCRVYGRDGEVLPEADFDYEIGSITKTFTARLVARAVDEKRLALDDAISKYLALDDDTYYPTVRQLVTHTAGYKSYYFEKTMWTKIFSRGNGVRGVTKEMVLNRAKRTKLQDRTYPFRYSNFGYALLGLILEAVYEQDFTLLLNDFISEKIGGEGFSVATGEGNLKGYWQWNRDDAYIPAGGIIANLQGMDNYLRYCLADEELPYEQLADIGATPHLYKKLKIRLDAVAMAWIMDKERRVYWHNGGTGRFNSYMAFNRETKTGVVVLGNLSPSQKIPMTAIGARLMADLSAPPAAEPQEKDRDQDDLPSPA